MRRKPRRTWSHIMNSIQYCSTSWTVWKDEECPTLCSRGNQMQSALLLLATPVTIRKKIIPRNHCSGPRTWELFLFLQRLVAKVDFSAPLMPLVFFNKTWDSVGKKKKCKELTAGLRNVIHAHPRTGCGCHSTRHAVTSSNCRGQHAGGYR